MNRHLPATLAAALLATACGSSKKDNSCDLAARTGCDSGLVCEAVQGTTGGQCFEPVVLQGTVSDIVSAAGLNDAHVVALDANRAPLSTVAVTAGSGGAAGSYSLTVRADRDGTGKPVQAFATLRADKQGYQTFPGGIRTALPIDLSSASHDSANHRWTLTGQLTAVKLVQLTGGGTAWIHGTAARPSGGTGALVVAEPSPGGAGPQTGFTAIADESGSYAIFNLAAGTAYVVTAYATGANYTPVTTADLVAGDNGVAPLALAAGATATIDGGLIFNNGATSPVDVALVVESTYVPNLDRGESPPGLTVLSGASSYTFTGVPDGRYIVLAAYGIDNAVRDISGGGNTAPVQVTIQGGAVVGSVPGFKIKPAVHLLTIDSQTVSATPLVVTSATPQFTWQKENAYSSASTYRVSVFDSFGNEIWTSDQAAGNQNSATYAGATLGHGMYYQLRILALAEAMPVPTPFTVLSQTEDLLGVFTY